MPRCAAAPPSSRTKRLQLGRPCPCGANTTTSLLLIPALYIPAASLCLPSASSTFPSPTYAAASPGSSAIALLYCPAASAWRPSIASAVAYSVRNGATAECLRTVARQYCRMGIPSPSFAAASARPMPARTASWSGSIAAAFSYHPIASPYRPSCTRRLAMPARGRMLRGCSSAASPYAASASPPLPRRAREWALYSRAHRSRPPPPALARCRSHISRAFTAALRARPAMPAASITAASTM